MLWEIFIFWIYIRTKLYIYITYGLYEVLDKNTFEQKTYV